MYLIPIAAFCMAYYTVNVLQLHMRIKRAWKLDPNKRIKPIDCVQCLSVWIAVILWFCPLSVVEFLAMAFSAGFISTRVK